jgi:hypothetical protein
VRYHAFLAILLMVLSLPSSGAEPIGGGIAALVSAYFPNSKVTGGTRSNFPSYVVADFNGDGEDDVAVAIEDAETARRGQGCYALVIINSFRIAAPPGIQPFRPYECFKAYSIESMDTIELKVRNVVKQRVKAVGLCVRLTLTYDYVSRLCWLDGRYEELQ